ncbi:MAG: DUF3102 domain-containing protein [Phreatobacter sp.]|uniref:hypothetical protein n=1 Tax=Phreatobacter sp. TaxID=1966341 RepID=UPI001A578AC1|nr:hypothetical protein [Phreatobacter sp.]MBL8571730.1 DUF3102 domain-containing protein [Phreatobacter sp.]
MLSAVITTSDLPNLAREINDAHRQVRMHGRGMLMEAKRAGEALLVAKQQCAHGEFKAWINARTMVSYRQAAAYMRVAKLSKDAEVRTFDGGIDAFLDAHAEVSIQTLTALASEAGIEPGEAKAHMAKVQAAFVQQADKVARQAGVSDFADFTDWAWKHQPNTMREAIRTQAMLRSTEGYGALAREYMATMDQHDPHAILEADFGSGITAHRTQEGRIYLNVPGQGQVGWRQAVSLGLVKVSRR